MSRWIRTCVLGLMFVGAAAFAVSAQIFVAPTAHPGTPGFNVTHFAQISSAVLAAADGDSIEVAPGAYAGNIDLGTKNLWIYSTGGSAVTTINGLHSVRGFTVEGGQDATTEISGFRLLGCRGQPNGGGMSIRNGSSPVLRDIVFQNCTGRHGQPTGGSTGGYGGGAHVAGFANPRFEDCRFLQCRGGNAGGDHVFYSGPAGEGGAVAIQDNCRVEFRRCDFTGNRGGQGQTVCTQILNPLFYPPACITYARGRGGAIWTLFNSHVVLRDCVFQSNVGDAGGALFLQNLCGGLIERCRFESNLMTNDGSAYSCADPDPNCLSTLPLRAGGAIMARGDLVVRDTVFLNNTAANMPAGAVAIFPATSPITTSFRGCTFLGNEGEDRSQVGLFSTDTLLTVSFEECLIAEASSVGPSPVNFFDVSLDSQWTATFSDCASEQFLRTSPTTPVFSGTDLIDFEDAASGDLRLAVGSPFRDIALSARSAADASGSPRLRGAGLDLGALEADDPIGDLAGTANTALFLHVGVNGFTAAKPRAHDLVETDLLTIELIAGEGSLYGDAAYLAAEAQAVSQDPVAGPLRLALNAPFFLEEGTNQLAEASLIHAFLVPPGLDGLRLVLQGAAVAPDGTVTFSDAQTLHFRAAAP